MHSASSSGHLQRRLKNRHIQLIALGGTIGTGLFLGSAGIIELAGPGVILGYAIGGAIIFFIMRFLGEMLVEEPTAGSFSHFANRYVSPSPASCRDGTVSRCTSSLGCSNSPQSESLSSSGGPRYQHG